MNILILSRTAWQKDNSFGNTYSNIFGEMNDVNISNIYLADGVPDVDNKNVISYYRISEKYVTKSLLKKRCVSNQIGERIIAGEDYNGTGVSTNKSYDNTLQKMKSKRWSSFYIARELVWKFGQVNMDDMMNFVCDFKPDIIFLPFYYAMYVDRIALYIKKKIDIPIVLEASIDLYSLKQISFSPLYWFNRFCIRSMIRKTVKNSEKLYVISDKMKNDYQNMLDIDCDVLYKFPDPSRKRTEYTQNNSKLNFLFTGNIGSGRWKSLACLGKELKKSGIGQLVIYTPTQITPKMDVNLKYCQVNPPVTSNKVLELQNQADVLVHAESFNFKNKLEVRYSISTKVMDYISVGRCILAVGPSDIASIKYLIDNDLAIVATDKEQIRSVINRIAEDKEIIKIYAIKTSKYVEQKSLEKSPQEVLYDQLLSVIESYNKIRK